MRLIRITNESGVVQYDGDEPEANRDYFYGFSVEVPQKEAEHRDYLRGELRSENSEKVTKAIKAYRKKHPKKDAQLGEVTAAASIPSSTIDDIIDLLKAQDQGNYSLYGVGRTKDGNVVDWIDTTKRD